MTEEKQGASFRAKLLLLAVAVMFVVGGLLMYQHLDEQQDSPRPETPERYLSPADSEQNPPPSFSEPKVDENELLP